MKKIIYSNPIISTIFINIVSFIIAIYSINNDKFYLLFILIFTCILNGNITININKSNKMQKAILPLIYFVTLLAIFVSNKYIICYIS